MAVIGDNAKLTIDQVVYAVANGNSVELERKLHLAFNEGLAPVRILRATITHYKKLYKASAHLANGQTETEALNFIKPPVLFLFRNEFIRQLKRWKQNKIEKALVLLFRAELECKKTGLPDQAICGRALISLVRNGQQRH